MNPPLYSGADPALLNDSDVGDYCASASANADTAFHHDMWSGDTSLAHTAPLSHVAPFNYGAAQAHALSEQDLARFHLASLQPQTYGLPSYVEPSAAAFNNVHGWTEAPSLQRTTSHPPFVAAYQYLPLSAQTSTALDPLALWMQSEPVALPQQSWANPGVSALGQNSQMQAYPLDLSVFQDQVGTVPEVRASTSMTNAGVVPTHAGEHHASHFDEFCALENVHSTIGGAPQFCPTPQASSSSQEGLLAPPSTKTPSVPVPDSPSPASSAASPPSDPSSSPSAEASSPSSDTPLSLPFDTPSSLARACGPQKKKRAHPQQSPESPRRFRCAYPGCGYVTKRKVDLSRHKSTHLGLKPWICCGFPVGFHPEAHAKGDGKVRVIAGVSFVGGCGKKYSREDSLVRHLKPPKPENEEGGSGERKLPGCVGDAHAKWQLGSWLE
ncbi:hypothetical protein L226DRAFT_575547 [Lentinus tigrinus ALCF2SS1-7]|uniref:C2H2-type domain-containing protein n=1 Tax=Lentinus tigrinus ALCF2SS1-6 TaxID=1328759 RepID=A0A5C2S994_9APHY|nr:hypothetical protein L227DRAFT_526043 [Lentinus tigrinus ALCF2SS1-6]RPD69553.1 hypothetical protein L226DRAFT_575547 [Lentinus tigrinus ALCF2SS1-7]